MRDETPSHILAAFAAQLPPILGVPELAELLHRHPGSIYRDLSTAPHRLPPPVAREHRESVRWLTPAVLSWLATRSRPASNEKSPAVKRGRPSKVDQIRRRMAAQGGQS